MEIYINKKFYKKIVPKNNSFYKFIEINDIKSEFLISKVNSIEILITDKKDYFKEYNIDWNHNSLEYYNKVLYNDRFMFINCDMYDDFLEFKISIKKENNKIYLNSIKHILNIDKVIFDK